MCVCAVFNVSMLMPGMKLESNNHLAVQKWQKGNVPQGMHSKILDSAIHALLCSTAAFLHLDGPAWDALQCIFLEATYYRATKQLVCNRSQHPST